MSWALLALALAAPGAPAAKAPPAPSARVVTRCGWFSNPTPGNAWLADADGLWVVGFQGGFQAEGDWPDFDGNKGQWVNTNGSYGYGCACLRMTPLDASRVPPDQQRDLHARRGGTHYIGTILSGTAKPLAACRKDRRLPRPE